MDFSTLRDEAERRDRRDSLSELRDEFVFPEGPDGDRAIYFCGNSLGLQPRRAREIVDREMDEWAEMAVDGHFDGEQAWSSYHDNLAGPMSRIVGASPDEVVVMNTLTANLHFMLVSFYRPDDDRYKIIMEGGAFPSDEYAFKSQADFHGYDPDDAVVHVEPREGEATIRTEDILQTIEEHGDETALVCLSGLQYYTGQIFDMETITEKAHEVGAKVGWDLAHAVGNAELELHEWGPDFAVWCTYKYLNGGPGSVAGCFVHDRWSEAFDLPRFAGWWGNRPETRFEMKPEFDPAPGAAGWQVSNAPILSMAPLEASLELFDRAGMEALRTKSKDLTGWMLELIDRMPDQPFEIITPRAPQARGCQLSIRTPAERGDDGGRALYRALREGGVVCDYREPRVIRVAPTPMYNSYMDVWRFCRILYDFVDG
jgi:kynureninase